MASGSVHSEKELECCHINDFSGSSSDSSWDTNYYIYSDA